MKLMSPDEKEKPPTFERYTAFNAIFDALKEKERKKSLGERVLHRLGFSSNAKSKFQKGQASAGQTSESNSE